MKKLLILIAVTVASTGCYPNAYTHIEQADDGYIITKNQAGFLRARGELWHCKPQSPEKFKCTQLGHK